MSEEIRITESLQETEAFAAELAARMTKNDFIALYGEMGVGKTAFVRGLVRAIAPEEHVCSPTYSIVHEYHGGAFPIYHFDVYRIDGEDELYSTGFYDYIGAGLCVCEWSEKIPDAIPENAWHIKLEKLSYDDERLTEKRKITVLR